MEDMNDAPSFAGIFWHKSPVMVVTSAHDNKINGQVAVTAVTSSILHSKPRLILGIWKGNYTHSFISDSRLLNIHLLKKDQIEPVKNFGFYTGREKDKFHDTDYFISENGCPVIKGVHSYSQCRVINAMDGGDMTTFFLDVEFGEFFNTGPWLTLDDFYTLAPSEWIMQYNRKLQKSMEFSLPIVENISYEQFKP